VLTGIRGIFLDLNLSLYVLFTFFYIIYIFYLISSLLKFDLLSYTLYLVVLNFL